MDSPKVTRIVNSRTGVQTQATGSGVSVLWDVPGCPKLVSLLQSFTLPRSEEEEEERAIFLLKTPPQRLLTEFGVKFIF